MDEVRERMLEMANKAKYSEQPLSGLRTYTVPQTETEDKFRGIGVNHILS